MAFPRDGAFLIALTYGPETDWVKNVLAVGECELIYRRKRNHCHHPELEHGSEAIRSFPLPVRVALRVIRAEDVLKLAPLP
jgi:hypothetical protein